MAIVQMKRVSVLSYPEYRKSILMYLQAFGQLEIESVTSTQASSIKKVPETLSEALTIFQRYKPKSKLTDLRYGKESMHLSELEEEIKKADWEAVAKTFIEAQAELDVARERQKEIDDVLIQLADWTALDVSAQQLDALTMCKSFVFSIPTQQYDNLLEECEGLAFATQAFANERTTGVLLICLEEDSAKVKKMLSHFAVQSFQMPKTLTPEEEYEALKEESGKLNAVEKEANELLVKMAKEENMLYIAEEYYLNRAMRKEVQQQLHHADYSIMVDGWVPAENIEELEQGLSATIGKDNMYFQVYGVENEKISKIPIKLKNNRLFRAFENLTEMYSTPKYNEVDPTGVTAIFYLIFFGMMVADLGYGLLMWAALFGARIFLKNNPEMKAKTDFFYYLSYPIMVWGLVYGSFFGITIPTQLVDPSKDIVPILIISLVLGWLQLCVAMVLNVINSKKQNNILSGIGDGGAWLVLLIGVALVVISRAVIKNDILFYIGIGMSIIALLIVVIVPIITNKSKFKGLAKGLYAVYGVTGYVGDLVSYTRLMALGVAGASIGLAFNTILDFLPTPVKFTIGLVLAPLLHLLNLALSLLSAYVHGIRLQFVEFFGKFFTGGGRKFKPLQTVNKHFHIQKETDISNSK